MPTILITGAAGRLGQVLRAHLSGADGITLRLTDKENRGDPAIVPADLATPSPEWTGLFEDVDAVLHLAANGHPAAGWPDLIAPNVDAPLNVYLAAARHKVPHVVLASSIWASAARRDGRDAITAGDPDPGDNRYGASKLFAERIAQAFWRSGGVASTILRIGAYAQDEGPARLTSGWDAEARLSRRDLCEGVERALRTPLDGVRTLNLISSNRDARFTLDEASNTIGYVAADRFEKRSPDARLTALLGRIRRLARLGFQR